MQEISLNNRTRFYVIRKRPYDGDFEFGFDKLTLKILCDTAIFYWHRKFFFELNESRYEIRGGLSWPYCITLNVDSKMILELSGNSTVGWRAWKSAYGEFQNSRSNPDCGRNFRRFALRLNDRLLAGWSRGTGSTEGVMNLQADSALVPMVVAIVVSSLVRWDSSMS
jgi:hypothetical protein